MAPILMKGEFADRYLFVDSPPLFFNVTILFVALRPLSLVPMCCMGSYGLCGWKPCWVALLAQRMYGRLRTGLIRRRRGRHRMMRGAVLWLMCFVCRRRANGESLRGRCIPPCGQTEVLRRFCPGGGVLERRPGDDKAFRIPLYRRFRAF